MVAVTITIPDFWIGFLAGVVLAVIALLVFAFWIVPRMEQHHQTDET